MTRRTTRLYLLTVALLRSSLAVQGKAVECAAILIRGIVAALQSIADCGGGMTEGAQLSRNADSGRLGLMQVRVTGSVTRPGGPVRS